MKISNGELDLLCRRTIVRDFDFCLAGSVRIRPSRLEAGLALYVAVLILYHGDLTTQEKLSLRVVNFGELRVGEVADAGGHLRMQLHDHVDAHRERRDKACDGDDLVPVLHDVLSSLRTTPEHSNELRMNAR